MSFQKPSKWKNNYIFYSSDFGVKDRVSKFRFSQSFSTLKAGDDN